jgi:hypothetical protein
MRCNSTVNPSYIGTIIIIIIIIIIHKLSSFLLILKLVYIS